MNARGGGPKPGEERTRGEEGGHGDGAGPEVDEAPRRTRIGAYGLCLDDDRRVLLCRVSSGEADGGRWTLPGGGVEFAEDPRAAAVREFREETGLIGEVAGGPSVDSTIVDPSSSSDGAWVHSVRVIYPMRVVGGLLRDEPDGSTDTAAWFTEGAARALPLVDLAELGLTLAFGDPETEARPPTTR